PYTITGQGKVSVQEEVFFRFEADGRQIDLDRFENVEENRNKPTFESRLAVLRSILERIPVPTAKGEINAILPAVVAGDTFIRDVKSVVRPFGDGWDLRSFSAVFPGNTVVEANGRLGIHEKFGFAGKILVASRQPSGLAAWMSGGVDAQIRRLKSLGLSSDITLTGRQATFENLELRMDDAVLNGRIQRLAPVNGRAALITELRGNRVNIQDLRALYSLARDPSQSELVTHDLDIKVKADLLEAQFLDRPILAGKVDAHVRVRDGNVSVERLNAGDFYGSRLKSFGRLEQVLENPDGNLRLDVDAENAARLLTFLRGFSGEHFLLDALRSDPVLTRDTRLSLELDTRSTGTGAKGQLLVEGVSGGTNIFSRVAFDGDLSTPKEIEIDTFNSLSNVSTSALARQLSIDTLPEVVFGDVPGPFKLGITMKGSHQDGFATDLSLSSPTTTVSAKGKSAFLTSQDLNYNFDVTLGSEDIAPYLIVVGASLPGITVDTPIPVSLTFNLDKKSPAAQLSDINGQVAGNTISANLKYQFDQVQRPRLSGQVKLARLHLPTVAESVFGFTDILGTEALEMGTERGFQLPLLAGYDARLEINAERIETGLGVSGDNAKTQLVMLDGAIDLNNLRFETLGGVFDGSVNLKNAERTVLGTLRYTLTNVALEQLLQSLRLSPVAEAVVTLNGSAESSGKSVLAMISNVSGNGVISMKALDIKGINSDSLETILLATDVEGFEINAARVGQLVEETVLDSAIQIDFIDAPFSITRGRGKIRNLLYGTPAADFVSSIDINFPNASLDAETNLTFKPGRRDAISGADPALTVSWNGPFESLERTIDVGQLEGYLSLRAFENSQRRIETLEAQVIEKQRIQREIAFNFAREQHRVRKAEERLKQVEDFERRRVEEAVRKLQEERDRLAAEAKLREETERQRLEEEARKKAAEQARLLEEQRKREAARLERERLRALEEQARREAEAQIAAQRAAEEAARLQQEPNNGIQSTPLPPPEPEIAPSLRESIIQNIENFLNTN
ncbi:MAG: AsmA-like C-terminal region-containing protein, partial [Pseudomonadota bacterium]